jgi:hypothetical protein
MRNLSKALNLRISEIRESMGLSGVGGDIAHVDETARKYIGFEQFS